VAKINETCFFNEQCEKAFYMMECKDGVCVCKFQRQAVMRKNGSIECIRKPLSDLHVFLVKFAFFKNTLG